MTASTPIVNVLHTISPEYISSIGPTLSWLIYPPIHWKPSKIKAPKLNLFLFFCPSIRPPQTTGKCPPPHVPPVASPLQHPIPHRHHRSVDCCVSSSRGRHPRPVSAHLSIFRCVPLGCPNQSIPPQRAQARAFGACIRLIGSRVHDG